MIAEQEDKPEEIIDKLREVEIVPAPATATPPYPASGSTSLNVRPDMAAMGLFN